MPETKEADELDTEALLASLEEEGDEVPAEVVAADAGTASAQGRASHAFAEQKRKAKVIAALARKQQLEIEELKKNQKSNEPVPPPAPTAGGAVLAKSVLVALTNQAMQNLGLFTITSDEERELVGIERNRLYGAAMNRRDEEFRVSSSAPRVIEEKLAKFDRLDDEGRAEVAKRLGSYNVLQRTDDDVIRSEVIKYLGELTLTGRTSEAHGENGDGSAAGRSPQERSSAQAAASSVKLGRGNPGVKPGANGHAPAATPKPPTPEEVEEMHKLKMTDVVALRAAKQRSAMYKNR